jgi:hypothetical protein
MDLSSKEKKRYLLVILFVTGVLLALEIMSGNLGMSLFFIILFGGVAVAYIHYEKFATFINKYF